jgi:hypothetical protein
MAPWDELRHAVIASAWSVDVGGVGWGEDDESELDGARDPTSEKRFNRRDISVTIEIQP